jgi:hypothetical protein
MDVRGEIYHNDRSQLPGIVTTGGLLPDSFCHPMLAVLEKADWVHAVKPAQKQWTPANYGFKKCWKKAYRIAFESLLGA